MSNIYGWNSTGILGRLPLAKIPVFTGMTIIAKAAH